MIIRRSASPHDSANAGYRKDKCTCDHRRCEYEAATRGMRRCDCPILSIPSIDIHAKLNSSSDRWPLYGTLGSSTVQSRGQAVYRTGLVVESNLISSPLRSGTATTVEAQFLCLMSSSSSS